jgi:hypothetical protein
MSAYRVSETRGSRFAVRGSRSLAVRLCIGLIPFTFLFVYSTGAADVKSGREEGEFRIYFSGKDVGNEKFVIVSTAEASSSTSILQFRNPSGGHEKIQLETKLDMGPQYLPRRYELKSEVNGLKGTIVGTFNPNQVIFEYMNGTTARKSGLLVGEKFTVLDTNIFHHFIFLARLYDFDGKGKTQKFEVAIPQEPDSGFLQISEIKGETLTVRGKKVETHHLQADSGTLVVDLWVDNQRILHKIAVKSKEIEVIRGN